MRRKGIEPIVSVVLLLLITIALAGGVLVWLTGYVGGLQGDFTTKGVSCQRTDANTVTFRGYLVNIQDSPLPPGSIIVSQLGGPTAGLTLDYDSVTAGTQTSFPATALQPGAQALFSITANKTPLPRGTYTLEFAGNSIEKVAFNCP